MKRKWGVGGGDGGKEKTGGKPPESRRVWYPLYTLRVKDPNDKDVGETHRGPFCPYRPPNWRSGCPPLVVPRDTGVSRTPGIETPKKIREKTRQEGGAFGETRLFFVFGFKKDVGQRGSPLWVRGRDGDGEPSAGEGNRRENEWITSERSVPDSRATTPGSSPEDGSRGRRGVRGRS